MEKLKIKMSPLMELFGRDFQKQKRLFHSSYKNKPSSKKKRKIIRGLKKSKDDKNKETEGTLYKAGSFH